MPEEILRKMRNVEAQLGGFLDGGGVAGAPTAVVIAIAHRREAEVARPELLFAVRYQESLLFFCDLADAETTARYFASRRAVVAERAKRPCAALPAVHATVSPSKDGASRRPYQTNGMEWLLDCWHAGHGAILADEDGLGKMAQALAFLDFCDEISVRVILSDQHKGQHFDAVIDPCALLPK
jgi:hypothetical protein